MAIMDVAAMPALANGAASVPEPSGRVTFFGVYPRAAAASRHMSARGFESFVNPCLSRSMTASSLCLYILSILIK